MYIASVWPQVCEHLVNCENPGKCLVIGNTVYLLGVFGMVWCTAYNFVPFGGELARERTYVIIGELRFYLIRCSCLIRCVPVTVMCVFFFFWIRHYLRQSCVFR